MEQHYDAAYDKSRGSDAREIVASLDTPTLDDAGQETLADAIIRALK